MSKYIDEMSPVQTYNHRSDNDLDTSVKLSSKVRIMISFQKYAYDSAILSKSITSLSKSEQKISTTCVNT